MKTDAENAPHAPKLTRAQLSTLAPRPIHRARNWSKAQVSVLEWPPASGQQIVVKDLAPCALWFRLLAGRTLLRREWRALQALQVLAEVPAPIAWIDADAFAMEFRAGRALVDCEVGTVESEALQDLETVLSEVHTRGVTHGDLHADNILLDENNQITLIDWATAGVFGKSACRGAKKWTFDEWRALDQRALAKLKKRHAPQLLSEREELLLHEGGSRAYRAVKRFRRVLHRGRKKPNLAAPKNQS